MKGLCSTAPPTCARSAVADRPDGQPQTRSSRRQTPELLGPVSLCGGARLDRAPCVQARSARRPSTRCGWVWGRKPCRHSITLTGAVQFLTAAALVTLLWGAVLSTAEKSAVVATTWQRSANAIATPWRPGRCYPASRWRRVLADCAWPQTIRFTRTRGFSTKALDSPLEDPTDRLVPSSIQSVGSLFGPEPQLGPQSCF